jgi:CheY-like chemotaxis protein
MHNQKNAKHGAVLQMNSPIQSNEDDLVFLDEPDASEASADSAAQGSWRIMIIDDDPDVHSATTFALGSLEIQHRPLSFLHAYSAAEAREILQKEKDIAIILLDVVMEHEDAGLQLVNYIRKTLGLADVRIILRTGQPGYAPEIDAIRDYDINDYKTKSELTRTKLYTAVTSAIRSYEQICSISSSRRGLEMIINASTELMATHGLHNFATGVLTQITSLLGLGSEGFVCIRPVNLQNNHQTDDLQVIACTARYQPYQNQLLKTVQLPVAPDIIHQALNQQQSVYEKNATVLYFNNTEKKISHCFWIAAFI